jgi:uncharacterized membrane protein YsdA (DUF1294 family)
MPEFLQFLGLVIHHYWWPILILLLLWNASVYSMYVDDKRRAVNKERRISESTLLSAAFFGGAIGAVAACLIARHKTQKKSFADQLFITALIQMLVFGGAIGMGMIGPN